MSITVEFGSKAEADQYRDDYKEYICPVDDDARLKTVAFVSDTPDNVLEQAHSDANITGADDPRARDAVREQLSRTCDHAADHCEHGDPEACEFLKNACGFDEDEVATILDEDGDAGGLKSGDPDPEELTGEQAGAIHRSMGGYAGAVDSVESAIETLRDEWDHAQQAAKAVNSVRESAGYEPQHFDRLEELQAQLLDLARMMAADCEECHADHSAHDHDVDAGDREDVREAVVDGAASTPVGTSEET